MKRIHLALVSCLVSSLIGVAEVSANTIGPQPITPTPISKGTIFASPTGSGATCSKLLPCSIWSAVSKAVSGSVVFLRGGTYPVTTSIRFSNKGTAVAPVIFESYPGETAILDGSQHAKGTKVGIFVPGRFIQIRGIEVKNMPMEGIAIYGNDNILMAYILIITLYRVLPYGVPMMRILTEPTVLEISFAIVLLTTILMQVFLVASLIMVTMQMAFPSQVARITALRTF